VLVGMRRVVAVHGGWPSLRRLQFYWSA
jgi:hypothetical protein